MCNTQIVSCYTQNVVKEKFPLHDKRDVGYSAAVHASWGLLEVSSHYGTTLQFDWEMSITFVREQLFGQTEMADTYPQMPLPRGKLWSVKTPELLC